MSSGTQTQLVMESAAAWSSGSATASALVLATQLAIVSVAALVNRSEMMSVTALVTKLALARVLENRL